MTTQEFTIEMLDDVLNHPNITVMSKAEDYHNGYSARHRSFSVHREWYRIKWFCNVCFLQCGHLCIPFKYVKQKDTWPNNTKMNLQFYDGNDRVCCVLPIEYYEREVTENETM